jgi:hypothetical protein
MELKKTGRNFAAVQAQFRTGAGPMKDRRAERGGAVNSYTLFMEEAKDDFLDLEDVFTNDCDD